MYFDFVLEAQASRDKTWIMIFIMCFLQNDQFNKYLFHARTSLHFIGSIHQISQNVRVFLFVCFYLCISLLLFTLAFSA